MEKKEILDNLYWSLGIVNEILKSQRSKANYKYKDAQSLLEEDVSNYVNPVCRCIEDSRIVNFLFHLCTSLIFIFIGYKMDILAMIWPVNSIMVSLGMIIVMPIAFVTFIIISHKLIKKILINRVLLRYIDRAIWNRKAKKYNYKKKYNEVTHRIEQHVEQLKGHSILHADYWNSMTVKILIKYFEHGRVSTMKEAINKYCEESMLSDLIAAINDDYAMERLDTIKSKDIRALVVKE